MEILLRDLHPSVAEKALASPHDPSLTTVKPLSNYRLRQWAFATLVLVSTTAFLIGRINLLGISLVVLFFGVVGLVQAVKEAPLSSLGKDGGLTEEPASGAWRFGRRPRNAPTLRRSRN